MEGVFYLFQKNKIVSFEDMEKLKYAIENEGNKY